MDADERLGRAHRLDQRANADDGHDTFEIVGQHVQSHFGADILQRLRVEVGIAHPVFDGPERVLDGFAPLAHLLRVLVEVSVANSYSRGDREFEKATAMLFPSKVAQHGRMRDHTAAPFRRRVTV